MIVYTSLIVASRSSLKINKIIGLKSIHHILLNLFNTSMEHTNKNYNLFDEQGSPATFRAVAEGQSYLRTDRR